MSYKSFAKGLARFVSLHENSISTDGEKERDKSFVGGALLDSDDFAAPSVEGSASGQTVDSFISNLADLDISASSHTVRLAKTRDSIMLARKKGVKARDSMELTRKKGVGKIEKMKPSKTSKNETKPLKDSNAKKPGVSKPSSKRGADQVAPKPPKTPHPIPSDPEMDELVFAKAELAVLGAKTANGQTRARSSNGRDAKTVGGKQRANTRGR